MLRVLYRDALRCAVLSGISTHSSHQAVVSVNSLVRHKSTQAGLTEGVWSLVQQYEGQLVGMTQYVLQETLPGLTLYVETRASDFLISHNLSKVCG